MEKDLERGFEAWTLIRSGGNTEIEGKKEKGRTNGRRQKERRKEKKEETELVMGHWTRPMRFGTLQILQYTCTLAAVSCKLSRSAHSD